MAQGAFAEAVPHFREAARLHPEDASALSNLGGALLAAGRPEEAVAPLERAVALDPASLNARFNLARALLARGRHARSPARSSRRRSGIAPADADTRRELVALRARLGAK